MAPAQATHTCSNVSDKDFPFQIKLYKRMILDPPLISEFDIEITEDRGVPNKSYPPTTRKIGIKLVYL